MTATPTLYCRDDGERRRLARGGKDAEERLRRAPGAPLNGLDYVEVSDDQVHLTVFFLEKAPQGITASHFRIDGGRRVRGIRVVDVKIHRSDDPEQDDSVTVIVDRPGDYSTYTLCVVEVDEQGRPTGKIPADFDPRYACLCFSFKAGCPTDLDCKSAPICPEPPRAEPPIDYLAKDYASLRRLILDRLALVMPDWQERHVPDLGITLVELLAYAGDSLSYYQDAVATEAYLDTARQRISVRRHVRLVDYLLHEGCNARAWVTVEVSQTIPPLRVSDFYFITASDDVPVRMLKEEDLRTIDASAYLVFEPLPAFGTTEIELYPDHSEICFYTWEEARCCLPKGSTSATLVDPGSIPDPPPPTEPDECGDHPSEQESPKQERRRPKPDDYRLHLKPCDVLIFEEVKGPHTGNPADADPTRRHAVRLTGVHRSWDPLTRQLVVEIEWAREDALPFPLCISSLGQAPDCKPISCVSVARGNVLLVDHGRDVTDDLGQVPTRDVMSECGDECSPAAVWKVPGRFRPSLPRPNLTSAEPVPPCRTRPRRRGAEGRVIPASSLLTQDPHSALPSIALRSIPAAPNGEPAFAASDLDDPSGLAMVIANAGAEEERPAAWLRGQLPPEVQTGLTEWIAEKASPQLPPVLQEALLQLLQSLEQTWEARQDLLESGSDDRHFVVEVDDERTAHLRFGDGDCGRLPAAREAFRAAYRVGDGPVGNVGADTITHVVFRNAYPSGADLHPRNPMPAAGGLAPESAAEAKLRAPHVFRHRIERAVTADDYAAIVMRDFASRVQRAAAVIRGSGIGPQVLVAVDALAEAEASPQLLCEIERHLWRFRRMGHDVRVAAARAVPLLVELSVCARDGYLRGHVKAALLEALSNRLLPGGRRGFFHPDNLTFGEGIYLSRIVSVVQAVEGVESVRVTRLERLYEGPNHEIEAGVLPLGPLEVARLDNDPGFPEHGVLTLHVEGGR